VIHNYDRTASVSLEEYVAKLRDLKDLLENSPVVDVDDLPKDFKVTAKALKSKAEKAIRTAYHKASEAYYDLRDLKKLLDESAEAQK
jgi:hypothetical protein